jgi:hypothetical protein
VKNIIIQLTSIYTSTCPSNASFHRSVHWYWFVVAGTFYLPQSSPFVCRVAAQEAGGEMFSNGRKLAFSIAHLNGKFWGRYTSFQTWRVCTLSALQSQLPKCGDFYVKGAVSSTVSKYKYIKELDCRLTASRCSFSWKSNSDMKALTLWVPLVFPAIDPSAARRRYSSTYATLRLMLRPSTAMTVIDLSIAKRRCNSTCGIHQRMPPLLTMMTVIDLSIATRRCNSTCGIH